jgi:hypothetical protein
MKYLLARVLFVYSARDPRAVPVDELREYIEIMLFISQNNNNHIEHNYK